MPALVIQHFDISPELPNGKGTTKHAFGTPIKVDMVGATMVLSDAYRHRVKMPPGGAIQALPLVEAAR